MHTLIRPIPDTIIPLVARHLIECHHQFTHPAQPHARLGLNHPLRRPHPRESMPGPLITKHHQ